MEDVRHRVCMGRSTPEDHNWDLAVYTQVLGSDGEWGPWKCRFVRRVYVDPMVYDSNRTLRRLLTSLKC